VRVVRPRGGGGRNTEVRHAYIISVGKGEWNRQLGGLCVVRKMTKNMEFYE
jgi:hypothetical protein